MRPLFYLFFIFSFFSCQSSSQKVPTKPVTAAIPANTKVLSYKIRPSVLKEKAPFAVMREGLFWTIGLLVYWTIGPSRITGRAQ